MEFLSSTRQAIVTALCLLPAILATQPANAAVVRSSSHDGAASALVGTWCNQDDPSGETIVQYSAAGLQVSAFTVLSEADPRRIGQQASMQLTMESPNVFSRRDFDGAEEVFRVQRERLTVDSLLVQNRDTREEMRQLVTSQSYYRCDVRKALERAHAFMSSPRAEAATRKAFQRDAARKAQLEQLEREDAEMTERRDAGREAYYADLIQQLGQARGSR